MKIQFVSSPSSIAIAFKDNVTAAIRKFFETDLPEKEIEDYHTREFLEAFYEFLLEKELSKFEHSILDILIDFDYICDDYFYNEIDGAYGDNCIPDGIIYVSDINDAIYENVNNETWENYKHTDVYLVFLAVLIVTGNAAYVKEKLIKSIPLLDVWNDLFAETN